MQEFYPLAFPFNYLLVIIFIELIIVIPLFLYRYYVETIRPYRDGYRIVKRKVERGKK